MQKPKLSKNVLFILIAVVMAGLAAFIAVSYIRTTVAERTQDNRPMVDVAVPVNDLPQGAILQGSDLALRTVPAEFAPADAVTPDNHTQFEGRMLRGAGTWRCAAERQRPGPAVRPVLAADSQGQGRLHDERGREQFDLGHDRAGRPDRHLLRQGRRHQQWQCRQRWRPGSGCTGLPSAAEDQGARGRQPDRRGVDAEGRRGIQHLHRAFPASPWSWTSTRPSSWPLPPRWARYACCCAKYRTPRRVRRRA